MWLELSWLFELALEQYFYSVLLVFAACFSYHTKHKAWVNAAMAMRKCCLMCMFGVHVACSSSRGQCRSEVKQQNRCQKLPFSKITNPAARGHLRSQGNATNVTPLRNHQYPIQARPMPSQCEAMRNPNVNQGPAP